jgi:hypothetical protein
MHAIWFAGAALALPATLMPFTDSRDGVERTYECRGEPAVLADKDYWSGTQKRDVVVASADIGQRGRGTRHHHHRERQS